MPVLYVLKDPRTNAIRYTGKANHAGKRLASHLRDAKRRNTPLHRWIRELATIGLIPVIDTALEVSEAEWPVAEQAWISILRDDGHDLLNVAPGGDQPYCPLEVRQANGRRNFAKMIASRDTLEALRRDVERWEARVQAAKSARAADQIAYAYLRP